MFSDRINHYYYHEWREQRSCRFVFLQRQRVKGREIECKQVFISIREEEEDFYKGHYYHCQYEDTVYTYTPTIHTWHGRENKQLTSLRVECIRRRRRRRRGLRRSSENEQVLISWGQKALTIISAINMGRVLYPIYYILCYISLVKYTWG